MTTATQPIPTQVGDVLVLWTSRTFTVYAVRQAAKNAQQDFGTQRNVRYVRDRITAVHEAKALVVPGRRMFLWNIDTGDWSEVAD